MTGRLVRSADFQRILRAGPRARSEHFAVHHLQCWPALPAKPAPRTAPPELSTGDASIRPLSVDDCVEVTQRPVPQSGQSWLGAVVPKRHARRSVTRTQLKRQIRAVFGNQASGLAGGLWVVRLRAPFDRKVFVSAASSALGLAARQELEQLLRRVRMPVASP
jgi:ribonuclease P protein component